jgi:hypothetical protein
LNSLLLGPEQSSSWYKDMESPFVTDESISEPHLSLNSLLRCLGLGLLLLIQLGLLGCADPLSDSRGMLAEKLPNSASSLSTPPSPLALIDRLKFLEEGS